MHIIGLVVEYNPFHNGHLHHLREAKKTLPDETAIVCVMSGNWVQRGEPALLNKWARTAMALQGGADLVLELPTAFALQSAENFALGAVQTLAATNVVSHLCFGSEAGEISVLQKIAYLLLKEPPLFKEKLKLLLNKGRSYPAALSQAASLILADHRITKIIKTPNNILGVEYLKNLLKINSKIIPFTIPRKGVSYHSLRLEGNIASATAIRKGLEENGLSFVSQSLPTSSINIIKKEIEAGKAPVFPKALSSSLMILLRRSSLEDLYQLPGMEPGLPERFHKICHSTNTITEVLKAVATRRYTRPRLQRILSYLFLNISNHDLISYNASGPKYLRVLGFSPTGQKILHKIKKTSPLPLVTSPAKYFRYQQDKIGHKMLSLDIKAANLYNLLYPDISARNSGGEFSLSPLKRASWDEANRDDC